MALERAQFSDNEDINLLKPCWIAGEKKFLSTRFAKLFPRHEINAIDVVASSKRIRHIIDSGKEKRESNLALQIRSCGLATFKDISRLTFGASYILGQQVSTLLDETKHLLDQIMGNKFELAFDVRPQAQRYRKRKHIISKTMTICVAKRARIEEPQLLDKQNVDYYRQMLTELELWNTQSEDLKIEECETIQVDRNCLSEHVISVTHELTYTEIDQDLMPSNGFGESNQSDLIALEEFLPLRNSLKRKSPELSPTGVLSYKTPRLGGTTLEIPTDVDIFKATEEVDILPLPPVPQSIKKKSKSKKKLLVDKVTKLSHKTLMEHREGYSKALSVVKPKVNRLTNFKNGNCLITSFRQEKLFPDRLKMRFQHSCEDLELTCENTIRSIFEDDYNEELAKEILAPIQNQSAQNDPYVPEMPITEQTEPTTSQSENNNGDRNNNNNVYEETKSYKDMDSYNVMMNLLNIWRNNADLKSIDANKFFKSFPDRITKALAFSHLLTLSRDGFIELSKKPGSLEIDGITLGVESNRLIEDIL